MTPCKSIRKYCIGCAGSVGEVRKCIDDSCPLFIYRFGKNPRRKGIGNHNINSMRKNINSTNDFLNQSI